MNDFLRGATNARIKDLQSKLIEAGYKLPRFGADAEMGDETIVALTHWASDFNKPEAEGGLSEVELPLICEDFLRFFDSMQGRTPRGPRHILLPGDRDNIKGVRDWKTIDAIVLHMTACSLSPERWKTVPIHFGVPRSSGYLGKFFQLHPLTTYLYHANTLNARSIGFEIEGNFCGVDNDNSTWWPTGGGPQKLEAQQVESARAAINWVMQEARASGYAIKYIFAHRQASKDRRSDPGEAIWREIGLWAQYTYELSDGGPGFKVGDGYLLPDAWTLEDRGVKY